MWFKYLKSTCCVKCDQNVNMVSVKKKRVSKKNKKSWRKNIDIKDVDNFLEDLRLEERLGVKYSEKKNDELFEIDTQGRNETNLKAKEVPLYTVPKSKRVSKRLVETEIPKSFQILYKRSAVPPHIFKKAREKTEPKTLFVKKILRHKLKKELLKAKKIEESKIKEELAIKRKNDSEEKGFSYNVWAKKNEDRKLDGCSEWLSNDAIRHTLHNTGKLKRQTPKTILTKTSKLSAIESPHPGISYNPSLKDHTEILQKVAEEEINITNKEKHYDRVTTKMFQKIPRNKLEKEWLNEMTVGLSAEKSGSDDDDLGDEYKAINPPVKNKKKTLKKRRKLREAMLLKQKLKEQKIEKRKLSDIYKLRKFNEMLNKKEEKTKLNIEKRKKKKELKPLTTKLLSQVKYTEPQIDFTMPEKLSGNMRNVIPEGNLLFDRFKSLQKRNILEPTLKRHVKKRKMKRYERENTKMEWESQGFVSFKKSSKKTKV